MKHGDFTGLAENYSLFRPKYSPSVLKSLIALLDKPVQQSSFVDVGAGTGIWTRMLAQMNPGQIIAIEPNEDMRRCGIRDSVDTKIVWQEGTGEKTNLPDQSVDIVSMASSFHWVDFEKGCREFSRILKKNGRFISLWNPRLIEANPLLKEIESYLYILNSELKRVSSGRSGIVETLTERLYESGMFTDVVYIEGRHNVQITSADYIGAWRSVNDVQFQLGEKKFEDFINYIETRLETIDVVDITYLTRAWSALKR